MVESKKVTNLNLIKKKNREKVNSRVSSLSPREIVSELDRFVIGQKEAKKETESFIKKILKIDQLHYFIDFKKFNKEETELIKLICYKNQQLNLLSIKSKNNSKNFFLKNIYFFNIGLFKKITANIRILN